MIHRWWQFIRERFDPVSHLLMIALFVQAHRALVGGPAWAFVPLFLRTAVFFFKLRLYDELKDYELDRVTHPERPLVRGLLSHRDLYRAIALCLVSELALFGFASAHAAVAVSLAVGYSLLMYREFFIPGWIRPHLTTYALSHTLVCGMLSLALSAAFSGRSIGALGRSDGLFALNSWCLFNIFEFGRKTFVSSEERPGVESYSKIFGRAGAVALVLLQAGISAFCLLELEPGAFIWLLASSVGILLFAGSLLAFRDRAPYGQAYRVFSSVYIVLIYLGYVGMRSC